jgi:hypothetical protein
VGARPVGELNSPLLTIQAQQQRQHQRQQQQTQQSQAAALPRQAMCTHRVTAIARLACEVSSSSSRL